MKRQRYKHLLNFAANVVSLIVYGILFAILWYKYYANWNIGVSGITPYFRRGNWAVIGMYLLFIFFFTKVFGGYRIGYLRLTDIILSNVLALLLGNIVAFFELCLICRDYVNPMPLIDVMMIEVGFIVLWSILIREGYKALYPPRQMIVVYGMYPPDELIDKINTRRDKYDICATISCTVGKEKLFETISEYQGVVLCDLPAETRNDVMKYCYQNSIRVYCTPKISDILFRASDNIHLFDTPLYLLRNQGLSITQRFFKRFFDIILSLIGILLASPFMLVIAICIKLYDWGPILYTQERLTRDHTPFKIYKFRSMTTDSEKKGARLAAKGDSRVTPVGNIIRNIHFDELPQLFNILKGDMSLVGPRPERQIIAEQYMEEIPEFAFRTKVKAGLTGYAQVWGKYNTTPYDKLKMDITYIENYSLWLDIKILLLTFKILFVKENTEGVEQSQTTAMKKH
ncbi:exopolysaccharide biosynthesis polyprenyl glycosylphosphotransferase [Lachnobacterium bovis]|uniref:Exopolysaccharide biosynthesis polyprenyl glycosylphosphotransferase n=1 Tax=Lachnobacterium bovis TaxID=140626 RepID=A0A1H9P000_9FIRM|nr:exopolysaccharide biosynthesis polyprenyl glycosylphosphotransferase [Lachnobacterium bovis]SER41508.1 exopolysaccharide biosynthesis polyprenyl glycosylphosphotransferase [Lachnobacterium bovis]